MICGPRARAIGSRVLGNQLSAILKYLRELWSALRDLLSADPNIPVNETLCSKSGSARGAFPNPTRSVPTGNTSSRALPVRISAAAGANS